MRRDAALLSRRRAWFPEFIGVSDDRPPKSDDPRRHYVTPLDTNTPKQYTPPSPKSYEA